MVAETRFICGQCRASRTESDVVVEKEIGRGHSHICGFVAIRCREHANARQLATRAVQAHIRRAEERMRTDPDARPY